MDKELIKSYLNLHAVLTGLGTLCEIDEEAKGIAKGVSGTVQLTVRGGPSVQVIFDGDGTVRLSKKSSLLPSVGLLFLSPSMLNRMFEGEKIIPIVWTGVWRLKLIKAFTALTERFGQIMDDTDAYLEAHPDELFKVLSILFRVAMNGVVVLAEQDEQAAHFIESAPEGVARFVIGSGKQTLKAHFVVAGGKVSLRFSDVKEFNAELAIPNLQEAYDLFTGKLDALAAVGLGKVVMRGNLILLDQINAVLDRLGTYLA